jgi:hypothetical protein
VATRKKAVSGSEVDQGDPDLRRAEQLQRHHPEAEVDLEQGVDGHQRQIADPDVVATAIRVEATQRLSNAAIGPLPPEPANDQRQQGVDQGPDDHLVGDALGQPGRGLEQHRHGDEGRKVGDHRQQGGGQKSGPPAPRAPFDRHHRLVLERAERRRAVFSRPLKAPQQQHDEADQLRPACRIPCADPDLVARRGSGVPPFRVLLNQAMA